MGVDQGVDRRLWKVKKEAGLLGGEKNEQLDFSSLQWSEDHVDFSDEEIKETGVKGMDIKRLSWEQVYSFISKLVGAELPHDEDKILDAQEDLLRRFVEWKKEHRHLAQNFKVSDDKDFALIFEVVKDFLPAILQAATDGEFPDKTVNHITNTGYGTMKNLDSLLEKINPQLLIGGDLSVSQRGGFWQSTFSEYKRRPDIIKNWIFGFGPKNKAFAEYLNRVKDGVISGTLLTGEDLPGEVLKDVEYIMDQDKKTGNVWHSPISNHPYIPVLKDPVEGIKELRWCHSEYAFQLAIDGPKLIKFVT